MGKIDIVYIISSLIKAGPENVLYDIVSNLDKNKFHITIVTLKKPEDKRSRVQDFENLGIKIIPFVFNKYQLEFCTPIIARKIKKILPNPNNCILHAHCYHPTLICQYFKEYKKIVTIHNISIEDFTLLAGRLIGMYMSYRFNKSLSNFDKSVAISDYMINYYLENSTAHLIKINNGVSSKLQLTGQYKEMQIIKKSSNKKYIVIVGRLSKRKNVLYAISELKELNREDFVCQLIGFGEEYENCKKLISNDSRFQLIGYKSNVQDFLMNADLYISASMSEGFPLSVLEALTMGVPSLLSSIPPHQEIVNNMSISGIKQYEVRRGELSKAVDSFLYKNFCREAISQKAHKLYSSQAMAKAYMALYSCINKSK